jgi:hypothetical protein
MLDPSSIITQPKQNRKTMSNNNEPNYEGWKAGGAAAAGAAAGVATSAVVGGMGLTIGGTAIAIGAAPIIAAGAVVGLAGYGIYKLFGGK